MLTKKTIMLILLLFACNILVIPVSAEENGSPVKKAIEELKEKLIDFSNEEEVEEGTIDFMKTYEEATQKKIDICTKENAAQIIKKYAVAIDPKDNIENAEMKNGNLQIKFENTGGGVVNPETEELISFWVHNKELPLLDIALTEEEARNKAVSFLNGLSPDYLKNAKDAGIEQYENEICFYYMKQEDGLLIFDSRIYVAIDKKTGAVIGYQSNWMDPAETIDVQVITVPGEK